MLDQTGPSLRVYIRDHIFIVVTNIMFQNVLFLNITLRIIKEEMKTEKAIISALQLLARAFHLHLCQSHRHTHTHKSSWSIYRGMITASPREYTFIYRSLCGFFWVCVLM